jgi:ring-1,2-phenylacetyl-CoA epoxidase subunit PaaC
VENKEALFEYVLRIADNALILGHRVSELCGHGPSLETDIGLTNIALDLVGHARVLLLNPLTLAGATCWCHRVPSPLHLASPS